MKIQKLNLFGKDYNVFSESCCSDTNKRTLYIDLLNICNAKCYFCSSRCNVKSSNARITSLGFIKKCVTELISKGAIDKIALTGGEPLYYPYLKSLFNFLDSLVGKGLEFYSLTTNGTLLKYDTILSILNNSSIKYVNISRHHYTEEINTKVYGTPTITKEELKEAISKIKPSIKTRINVCATEYISTRQDILSMYDFTKYVGANKLLIRKEYSSKNENYEISNFFNSCDKCKISNKCQCKIIYTNGIEIEYRVVYVEKEHEIEMSKEFIRNFVITNYNQLKGGWSEDSETIYNYKWDAK